MLRAFAASLLVLCAAPLAAQDRDPTPLERQAWADRRLLDTGWKLATASAGLCPDTRPALGLILRDARAYSDPAAVRAESGQSRDITVQAVATGSPAMAAGLRRGDELASLLGGDPNARPAEAQRDPLRLEGINDAIDTALVQFGAIGIGREGEAEWRLEGVPACFARFEVLHDTDRAASTGIRVQLGDRWTAGDIADGEFAFLVAHELAHNILKHRLQRQSPRGERPSAREVERAADRLAPWLMARAGYDPAGAIAFLETHGPKQDGPLYIGTSHDGWKSRRDRVQAQIDLIAGLDAAAPIDWRPYFAEELAAARAAMQAAPTR